MKQKIFQKLLEKRKIDVAIFVVHEKKNADIIYFTRQPLLTHALLIVPSKGKPSLYVSSLDYEGITIPKTIKKELLDKNTFESIKKTYKSKTLGMNYSNTTYATIKKFLRISKKIVDVSSEMEEVRLIKTTDELTQLKKAATIANNAFKKTLSTFNYKTEFDIKVALEHEMSKKGCTPSFPTIVASGKNAAVPHHKTSTQKLKKGFCVIDFGTYYHGYSSDCTRTIYIGKPNTQEIKLYEKVLHAQVNSLKKATIGFSCKKLDALARKNLGTHEKYFIHSLGHGIGIDVHEKPYIGKNSTVILKKNMVITIEPGVYIPKKLGIRIEDTLIVNKKPQVLTQITKDLIRVQ